MRKKTIFISVSTIALLCLGAAGYTWLSAPAKIQEKLQESLEEIGFTQAKLPEAQTQSGVSIFNDIALDSDGFSTIKSIQIHYDPASILFKGGAKRIIIDSLSLTGELDENNKAIIAGWNESTYLSIQSFGSATIQMNNTQIALLSEKWGGLSAQGDIQIRPSAGNIEFQANITTAQKALNAQLKIDGTVNKDGLFHTQAEIEQGKFTLYPLQASRVSGAFTLTGSTLNDAQILGELQAGALRLYEKPLQNGAITIDGTLNAPSMILAANATGVEEIEIGLNIPNIRQNTILSGHVHAATLAAAFDYLDTQNILPVARENLRALDDFTNITAQFKYTNILNFNIKDESENIDIKGNIEKFEGEYKGTATSSLIPLKRLENANTYSGAITLNSDFTYESGKLSGQTIAQLQNASLNYGALSLESINGSIPINDLKTLSGDTARNIKCKLKSLKTDTECTLQAKIKNGGASLTALNIKSTGINILSPQAPKSGEKTTLIIKSIDTKKLLGLLGFKTWQGEGTLQGKVTLNNEENKITLSDLRLKNDGKGILKLTDPVVFDLMQMEELEKETMKLALENFHYDILDIKAKGTAPDDVTISVFGKGRNPDLLQGRAFSLDFEITPDLTPLIAKFFSTTD